MEESESKHQKPAHGEKREGLSSVDKLTETWKKYAEYAVLRIMVKWSKQGGVENKGGSAAK